MRGVLPATAILGSVMLLAACGSSSGSKTAASPASTAQSPATLAATVAVTVTPAARFQPPTPASNPVQRVNGTVQGVSGNTVKLADGSSFTITPQTTVTVRAPGMASALQAGRTVAITAKPQQDGTLLASLIVVFPTAPNGFPLGQRPLDAGNLMTNATIDKAQGNGFSATFPGGSAQVTLASDAQILILNAGSMADIKPGTTVTAGVNNGVAQTVSVQ